MVTETTGLSYTFGMCVGQSCRFEIYLSGLILAGKEREHNLQAGDNVEVCEGELINLQGKILSVDGNKITIMPRHEDLKVHARTLMSVMLLLNILL